MEPATTYRRSLEDAGLAVELAADGLNGMRRALSEHPDLVVLDFLADDAPDVLRSRRALRHAGIPLLVLAPGRVASGEQHTRQTPVTFLATPVSPERLAAEASRMVEVARRRSRERAANNAGHA